MITNCPAVCLHGRPHHFAWVATRAAVRAPVADSGGGGGSGESRGGHVGPEPLLECELSKNHSKLAVYVHNTIGKR